MSTVVSAVKKAYREYERNLPRRKRTGRNVRRYLLLSQCAEWFLDEMSRYVKGAERI